MINACFRMGLDGDNLFRFLSPGDCYCFVMDFINNVLDLNGSYFFVDIANKDNQNYHSVPIRKYVGAPVHPKPAPSKCLSKGSMPACLPVFPRARKKISNSADLASKVVDPSIMSIRGALKKSFPCQPPHHKAVTVFVIAKSILESHPKLATIPESRPVMVPRWQPPRLNLQSPSSSKVQR